MVVPLHRCTTIPYRAQVSPTCKVPQGHEVVHKEPVVLTTPHVPYEEPAGANLL